ncbi:MAG: 3-deoxy-7-phosphoheptulonate synthase, partial [Lachnospiraceae bacterium]|nr:3-deoxy-7-phosphoheptulonate synthase [Lachnospiraceae bacterium]
MNLEYKREMPTARVVKEMYPVPEALAEVKAENDKRIQSIFLNESDKFLLVIGPCSADREDSVIEYITKLRDVQDKVADKIVIVPRIYTN